MFSKINIKINQICISMCDVYLISESVINPKHTLCFFFALFTFSLWFSGPAGQWHVNDVFVAFESVIQEGLT